jgi:hypothetical protein
MRQEEVSVLALVVLVSQFLIAYQELEDDDDEAACECNAE